MIIAVHNCNGLNLILKRSYKHHSAKTFVGDFGILFENFVGVQLMYMKD